MVEEIQQAYLLGILLTEFHINSSPHYIFINAQLWLTSHPRSTGVLLDTGTPGTSREIFQ